MRHIIVFSALSAAFLSVGCSFIDDFDEFRGLVCDGTTPILVDGQCVQCETSADCGGGICTAANVCVECVGDADCTQANAPYCVESQCVTCVNDASCDTLAFPRCRPDMSACVACLSDADCGSDRCDPSTFTCVSCLQDADCVPDGLLRCTSSRTCVACSSNADCTDGNAPFCSGAGSCVSCLQDSDCTDGAAPRCDTTMGQCVACLTNFDCTSATASECGSDGQCGGCTSNFGCGQFVDAPNCLVGTGCVECRPLEDDCSGFSCDPDSNECTTTAIGSRPQCDSCVASSECPTGTACMDHGLAQGCYPLPTNGTCPRVFADLSFGPTAEGVSVGYCKPRKAYCEAIRLLDGLTSGAPTTCTGNSQCAAVQGGVCRSVTGFASNVCTIGCDFESDCPADLGTGQCSTAGSGGVTYCSASDTP